MKKNLQNLCLYGLLIASSITNVFAQTAASAVWQPESSSNIPGTVQATGSITADPQGGTMEAFTYSTTVTAINDATGFQRTRSTTNAPQLPYGNVYDPNAYLQYKVSPSGGQFLKVTNMKVTILGGGTGNARLVVKYSTDGTNFMDMPVTGNYFLADASAATYAATEAQPVILINTGAAANPEANRTLSFNGINQLISPGQSFYVRLYPFLADLTLPSNRYLMSRQMVISGLTAATADVLPLDILSFTAKSGLGNQIKLDWKTTNEVNTKNFVVERSNGGNFASIGSIDSKNTAGEHSYSFSDNAPLAGINYYRLLQVDNDGKSKYSATVSAEGKGGITLSAYPSPVTGSTLTVSYPSSSADATLKVVTLGGAQVAKLTASAGSTSSSVDVSGLASGIYLVIYTNGQDEKSVKFVKQ
jgi:hypothetical protein